MSRVRITGGRARGRVLPGVILPGVRPTSARVREAWFSMVGQDLTGIRMLDAFAGSGIMALEAWSRGADVVAMERDRRAARAIRERAAQIGASIRVVHGDTARRAGAFAPYDLVFADPPYTDAPARWLPLLAAVCRGTLWYEAPQDADLTPPPGWRCARARRFGGTILYELVAR